LAKYLAPVGHSDELAAKIELVLNTKPNVDNADILQKVTAEQVAKQYLALCG
jgi:hypothetical protein